MWICDEAGKGIVGFGPMWTWNGERRELTAKLAVGESATLLAMTQPIESPGVLPDYDAEREACIGVWKGVLDRGSQLKIPEPIVQDAWRSLVIGNYLLGGTSSGRLPALTVRSSIASRLIGSPGGLGPHGRAGRRRAG